MKIIFYLNKDDIFSNKLQEFPLKNAFNDYNGGTDKEAALEFIRNLFHNIADTNGIHIVCCLNTVMTDKGHVQQMFSESLANLRSDYATGFVEFVCFRFVLFCIESEAS